jgi:hypothetical protein
MTWRARRLHAFVDEAAARHGATYVHLFHERADDPFVHGASSTPATGCTRATPAIGCGSPS